MMKELSFNVFNMEYSHMKTRKRKDKTPGNNNTRQKTKAENVKISEQTRRTDSKNIMKHTDNTGSSSLSKILETNYE